MSQGQRPMYIWEGVYETLEQAQVKGAGFESERWMERITKQLLNYRKEIETHSLVMPARSSALPFLAALTDAQRIIDFGGSSGWAYDFLQQTVPQNTIRDYVIVEIQEVVDHIQAAFLHAPPVSYVTDVSKMDCNRCGGGGGEIFSTPTVCCNTFMMIPSCLDSLSDSSQSGC